MTSINASALGTEWIADVASGTRHIPSGSDEDQAKGKCLLFGITILPPEPDCIRMRSTMNTPDRVDESPSFSISSTDPSIPVGGLQELGGQFAFMTELKETFLT